jgi:uncharacterized membrane protein
MDTTLRTFIKTLSYRITAALSVMLLSIILSYGAGFGLKFLIITLTIGFVIYFIHDYIWNKINFLRKDGYDFKFRSVIKTVTWRITSLIALFIVGMFLGLSSNDALYWTIANNIAFILIHYLHERVWNMISWGKIVATTNVE